MSKNIFYLGVIGYCAGLLLLQDWPLMTAAVGAVSAAFLGKMVLDIGFVGAGLVKLIGPALFEPEYGEEALIDAEDLSFSDTGLYVFFGFNVVANAAFHGYETVMTTGTTSFYFSIWFIAEAALLFLTVLLFNHAKKLARKRAAAARSQNFSRAA